MTSDCRQAMKDKQRKAADRKRGTENELWKMGYKGSSVEDKRRKMREKTQGIRDKIRDKRDEKRKMSYGRQVMEDE